MTQAPIRRFSPFGIALDSVLIAIPWLIVAVGLTVDACLLVANLRLSPLGDETGSVESHYEQ